MSDQLQMLRDFEDFFAQRNLEATGEWRAAYEDCQLRFDELMIAALSATAQEQPSSPMAQEPASSIDYQQRRGAALDIIDEAIATYEQWLLDDDYDPHALLKRMVDRMRERKALYAASPVQAAEPPSMILPNYVRFEHPHAGSASTLVGGEDDELAPLSELFKLDLDDLHTKLIERIDYWMLKAIALQNKLEAAPPSPTADAEPTWRECRHCGFECRPNPNESKRFYPLEQVGEMVTAPALSDDHREKLGKRVREVWVLWAKRQPNPKPSWLLPWEELSDPDKEVDRCIGAAIWGDAFAEFINGPDYFPAAARALLASVKAPWTCAARRCSSPEPYDCEWPVCNCDPHANKVMEALQESGALPSVKAPAVPEWITTRTPEIGELVLAKIEYAFSGTPITEHIVCRIEDDSRRLVAECGDDIGWDAEVITAWIPCPYFAAAPSQQEGADKV